MSDLMALLGMVPEPASVLDQGAIVGNQGVVDRNHAIEAIVGGRVVLEPLEPVGVDAIGVPESLA